MQEKHNKTHINQTNKNKIQRKNIKSSKGKAKNKYKGIPIRLSADFSEKTLQAKREWQDKFKVRRGKNLQSRLFYPPMISFRFDGEIKNFTNKQRLREFSAANQLYNKCYRNFSRNETQQKQKTHKNKPQTIKKMAIGTYTS